MDIRDRIERWAAELGFSAVAVAAIGPTPQGQRATDWLAAGHHGDMDWLERTHAVRLDPRVRMPDAKAVVLLSLTHAWRRPPDPGGRTGLVARYAWGRDYHNLIGKRLKKLRRRLREIGVQSFGGVDTAPIIERAWAARAGLGVVGKNGMLFVPGSHSWHFLAAIVIDHAVDADPPVPIDACKACTRCLVGCPTDAFVRPTVLDARRCIAYWTIEARDLAPERLRPSFGRWVFGCDVCQEVCPHNHHPPDPTEPDFLPRHAWLDLDEVLATPDDALDARFTGTPLRRPGPHGLKRNAAVVLGNLGDPGGLAVLHDHGLTHAHPVVREASRWAIARLGAQPSSSGGGSGA
jgi:epoxyqueuosine reductase